MYIPKLFNNQDADELLDLIHSNPFATLVSSAEGSPFVNHLPVIAETDPSGKITLLGHMARGNPQWRHFKSPQEVVVVFHGPQTYITPSWYEDQMNVPTWNYAVVHAFGVPKLIEGYDGIYEILSKTVNKFESGEQTPWRFDLPPEFTEELVQAIVGFEIEVTRFESKFKMSQNRSPEDRQGVLDGLKTRQDEMSRKVLDCMIRQKQSSQ